MTSSTAPVQSSKQSGQPWWVGWWWCNCNGSQKVYGRTAPLIVATGCWWQAKRRAEGEVLMTRAWRERAAAAASGPTSTQATLRVRFPEGVCLQVGQGLVGPVVLLCYSGNNLMKHCSCLDRDPHIALHHPSCRATLVAMSHCQRCLSGLQRPSGMIHQGGLLLDQVVMQGGQDRTAHGCVIIVAAQVPG
jgi:hypothetical protein